MPNPVHIDIAEPCHENWQQMTPNEQGRHCLSCQKTVVDFTFMSDQEILHYFSQTSTSVCGRFHNNQLNKTYAEKKIKPSITFRYAWNMITAAFLLTGSTATAQTKKKTKKKAINASEWKLKHVSLQESFTQATGILASEELQMMTSGMVLSTPYSQYVPDPLIEPRLKIFGLIRDGKTNKPIPAATIRIKGIKHGIESSEDGHFEFPIVDIRGQVIFEMSADGYVTQEYTVQVNSFNSREFYLDREPVVEDLEVIMGKAAPIFAEVPPPPPPGITTGVVVTPLTIVGDVNYKTLDTTTTTTTTTTTAKYASVCSSPGPFVEGLVGVKIVVDSTNDPIPPVDVEKEELPPPAGKSKDSLVLEDCDNVFTGGVTVTEEVSTADKIKREVKEWLPTKKELRVYPNPVMPGNTVSIGLQFGKTGEYKLQLIDASGRVVHVQALQVVQQSQVAQVPTQSSWSRGVYWVRISAAHDKKVYQAKVLLQ